MAFARLYKSTARRYILKRVVCGACLSISQLGILSAPALAEEAGISIAGLIAVEPASVAGSTSLPAQTRQLRGSDPAAAHEVGLIASIPTQPASGGILPVQMDLAKVGSERRAFDSVVPSDNSQSLISGAIIPLVLTAAAPDIVVKAPPTPPPPPWDKEYVPVDQVDAWAASIRKKADRYEVAYLAASAVDAIATIRCVAANKCKEMNPLMGKGNPTTVLVMKGFLTVAHIAGFRKLRRESPRGALNVARFSFLLQGAITGIGLAHNF